MSNKPKVLRRREIADGEETFSHPWNDNSEVIGTHLSAKTGLARAGVSLVRIPPGKESFVYHAHHREEEWIYILSGNGTARIDGEDFDIEPGDFMGFPTGMAHHLLNTGNDDLAYLMGGEHADIEVADFPDLDRRMIRRGKEVEIFKLSDARPFGPK
jgi:uncharacterized cupin superfamily protein